MANKILDSNSDSSMKNASDSTNQSSLIQIAVEMDPESGHSSISSNLPATTEELLNLALVEKAKLIEKFWSTDDTEVSKDSEQETEAEAGNDGELIVQQLLEACLRRLTNDNPDNEPEEQLEKYQFYLCWLQLGSLLKDKSMLQKAIDGASRLTTDFPQYHICVAHAHTEMASLQLREIQDSDTDVLISSSTLPWCKSIQSSIDSMNAYDQSRMNHDPPGHLQTLFLVNAILEMILVYPEVYDLIPESLNISMWIVNSNINWQNNWEYLMIEQLSLKLCAFLLEDDSYEEISRYEQVFRLYVSLLNQLEQFAAAEPGSPEPYERHGHILMQQIRILTKPDEPLVSESTINTLIARASQSFRQAIQFVPSTEPKYEELQKVLSLFSQPSC